MKDFALQKEKKKNKRGTQSEICFLCDENVICNVVDDFEGKTVQ